MPLADTSFLVDLMRRDSGALKRYAGFEQQGIALSTNRDHCHGVIQRGICFREQQ